jgi:hypothetical protein
MRHPARASRARRRAVNSQSASTTWRVTTRRAATSREQCAMNMKNAMPAPVRSSTAALMTCRVLSSR